MTEIETLCFDVYAATVRLHGGTNFEIGDVMDAVAEALPGVSRRAIAEALQRACERTARENGLEAAELGYALEHGTAPPPANVRIFAPRPR